MVTLMSFWKEDDRECCRIFFYTKLKTFLGAKINAYDRNSYIHPVFLSDELPSYLT